LIRPHVGKIYNPFNIPPLDPREDENWQGVMTIAQAKTVEAVTTFRNSIS
jgi:hypothetical protein